MRRGGRTSPTTTWSACVEQVAQLGRLAAAIEAGAVAEADHRDLGKQTLDYGSTGDWLTHLGGLRKGEGRRVVARAHALTGPLAATRDAMAAGTVSPEQADVIVKSVDALPSGTGGPEPGRADPARACGELRCHRPRQVWTPSGACGRPRRRGPEARAAAGPRGTSLSPGQVPLDRARRSRRGPGQGPRLRRGRRPPQGRAHAADRTGTGGRRTRRRAGPRPARRRCPDVGRPRADRAARLGHRPATRLPRRTRPAHGHHHPPVTAWRVWPTTPSTSCPSPPSDGWRATPRSSPRSSAARGEPLDVGRAKRLVTLAIWAALVIRDRHCAFPGCDRPPLMCHAHHILHWISGGETKLDNLVLLCGHHHRVIHHSPWDIRLNPDDHKPEFLPPPKPGVERHWIRYRPRRE